MNELGLVARLRNEASRELRDLRGDVRDFDREVDRTSTTTRQAGRNWGGLVSKAGLLAGGLGAAALAAQQAYQFIGEGADLRATEERFGRLSDSIGTTADALRRDLKDATGGLMSDAQLVASATEMMNLGLVKSHDETVRLASVAGQLNWDMQVLGLTLANNSTARLDSLGLSMEVVKARADELAAAGMSMDAAFDLAVIEAGEEKLELLGDAAETQAGKMQILRSRWQDFIASLKEFSSEAADPAVDALVALTTPTGDLQIIPDDLQEQLAQLMRTTTSFEEFERAATSFIAPAAAAGFYQRNLHILHEETTAYTDSLDALRRESAAVTREMDDQAAVTNDLARVTGAWGETHARANPYLEESLDLVQRNREAHEEYAARIEAFNTAMGAAFVEQVNAGADALFTLDEATGGVVPNTDAMADSLFNAAAAAGADAGQLALLGVATGKFSEEQAEAFLKAAALQAKLEDLGEEIASGLSIDEAMGKFQEFQTEINNTDGGLQSMAGSLGLVEENILRINGQVIDITTRYHTEGTPPWEAAQQASRDAGGTGGAGQGSEGGGATGAGDFASGGFTGYVPENMIAGRVHGQEYVLRAAAVRALGGPRVLDDVNASGRFPGGNQYTINVDARGATNPQATARTVEAQVERVMRRYGQRVEHGGRL